MSETVDTRPMGFNFDNSYAQQLDGFYARVQGDVAPAPRLLKLNRSLVEEMGLDYAAFDSDIGAALLSGSIAPAESFPLAQVYAGHQFGQFSPQLGDGRALLLGEHIDGQGRRRDIHLKGSGPTPFSRRGDGKAGLGPVLREYLMGEAMHALKVPTTRALAAVLTGENVYRETVVPGAVLARVASSHLRVGTFQYFAARDEQEKLKQLADYTIARHDPELAAQDNPYLGLLAAVGQRQAELVSRWMGLGFVHGVLNTDNVSLAGETIDYGPCAFMDACNIGAVYSSIDSQGRYAYGNQPAITQWNMARLAEALLPLIDSDKDKAIELATQQVAEFGSQYEVAWMSVMGAKIGLSDALADDAALLESLLSMMQRQEVDFTLGFRYLADAAEGNESPLRSLYKDSAELEQWLAQWRTRLQQQSIAGDELAGQMRQVNPLYIPRNHKVEEALTAAVEQNNYQPFEALLNVLENPFEEREGLEDYTRPAPAEFGQYTTFCGT